MIKYTLPDNWLHYDIGEIAGFLVDAKAVVLSLQAIPYQKDWVESLQQMELKREVAGTSRIEGADFTEGELDAAMKESPEELITRSQRQARAAVRTYRWIAALPDDRPMNADLIREIHRRIVDQADDDHCPPGELRGYDQNVTLGMPPHRGVEGGSNCAEAFSLFVETLQNNYQNHDQLVQALAAHYHLAALHPFLDGNGRTARALEALMLQRAGLRDTCFIAMSNYYYDEKKSYLEALRETRANHHDLTSFLKFGLKGIKIQSQRLLSVIRKEVSKELFRSMALNLFHRLVSKRKRIIADRQMEILNLLLTHDDGMLLDEIIDETKSVYDSLKSPRKALIRDLCHLIGLSAVEWYEDDDEQFFLAVNLDWPTTITETDFFRRVSELPKDKTYSFLH